MSESKPTHQKATIELTARGVFQTKTTLAGDTQRRKIARFIPATRYWHSGLRWRDFCPNPVPNDPQELSVRIFQNVVSLAEKQTRNQK